MDHLLRSSSKTMREEFTTLQNMVKNTSSQISFFVLTVWPFNWLKKDWLFFHKNVAFLFCAVFDEAALTDDLLLQLVEALKKHKNSAKENAESETKKDEEKETTEVTG